MIIYMTSMAEQCTTYGTSLVQWLRIHLPMQETWIPSLIQEGPTCGGATKPVCHSF